MPEALVFRLLGGLAVSRGGHPVSGFHSHKEQALLCYLAATARPHTRPYLAGLFWGDRPEPRALANLRRALTHLRAVAVDHLLITRQTVAFDREGDYWLDVEAFQEQADRYTGEQVGGGPSAHPVSTRILRLREAVDLYRGDFLEGFYVKGCPAFEEWVVVERERLRGLAVEALRALAGLQQARGEYPAAIEYTRRLLALDPWLEEAHRMLMHLLALNGQREQALAQYETCRRLLADELRLEPLEETTALYDKLVDWETGKWATQPAGLSIDQLADLPFVGRGEEHAALVGWWEAARQGKGKLALVEGEAGVGKTRLVEEVARYAETQGAAVLRGRCYEFGGGVPYQPIAAALRRATSDLQFQTDLGEIWLAELGRLVPEVRERWPNLPEPIHTSGEPARQRLFEVVPRFLLGFGQLVIFLDDLHWADQATLDLLHYLVRRLSGAFVWLVGTYRPEEIALSHPLTRLRQGLSRDHLVDRLILEPLSVETVNEIARSLVGEEASTNLGTFLYCESEGNPFILVETVNDLQDQGTLHGGEGGHWQWDGPPAVEPLPATVQDVILQRVGRLEEPAQRLLTVAAVIGRQFDDSLLQAAAGPDADAVDESLKAWLARRLVRQNPEHRGDDCYYDLAHDKIRAAVYHHLVSDRRKSLHGRVGQALLEHSGQVKEAGYGFIEVTGDIAAQVAYHFERGPDPHQAAPYLAQAARAAYDVYAYKVAIGYYQRLQPLLSEAEQVEVLIQMASAWQLMRQDSQAESLFRQAAVMGQRVGMYKQQAHALYLLADILVNQGDYRTALKSADQAEAAARLAGKEAWPELVMALKWKGWAHYRVGDITTASALAGDALALSRKVDDQTWEMESLNLLSATFNWLGDYEQGARCLEQALALSRALGNLFKESLMLNNLGYTAHQHRDYETAITLYQQALHISREIEYEYVQVLSLNNLGGVYAAVGEYEAAEEHLRQVLDMVGSRRWFLLTETYRYLAEVHLGRKEVDEALAAARQALALAHEGEARQYVAMAWRVLGRIAAQVAGSISVSEGAYDAAACFAESLRIFTELGMEGERARTLQVRDRHS